VEQALFDVIELNSREPDIARPHGCAVASSVSPTTTIARDWKYLPGTA
jgi:hypothetical protein